MMTGFSRWIFAGRRFFKKLRDPARFLIRPKDLVLDLGSGQDPHPRANILCDKFVEDNTERSCGSGLLIDRPMILADAAETPFPDKAFDWVFCSQLMEHVEDPGAVLKEIQRISRRGYIETPSPVYERLWGWPFHRWFVSVEEDRLVFEAKDRAIFDQTLHGWFSEQAERGPFWRFFIPRAQELGLLTVFVWEDEVRFEVRGEATAQGFVSSVQETVDEPLSPARSITLPQRAKRAASSWIRRKSDGRVEALLGNLKCVRCHAPLDTTEAGYRCLRCGSEYPRIGDVYVMLREAGVAHHRFDSWLGTARGHTRVP